MSDLIMQSAGYPGKAGDDSGRDQRAGFILALGRALHSSGEPTQRIEEVLGRASERLGLQAQFFVTPTSIFAAFGPEDNQRTHLIRTEPTGADLGLLADVDAIAKRVLRGELSPADGLSALDAMRRRPAVAHPVFRLLGFVLASACAARFLDGGLAEMATAGMAGLMVGLISLLASRQAGLARLYEPISAFTAAMVVAGGAYAFDGIAYAKSMLAALIVLVPGMMLTTAMEELTAQHLSSGTARLMGALTVFMGMGFGVALAAQLVKVLGGSPPLARADTLPGWTEGLALVVAAISFGLLLRAKARDLGWIVLAAVIGYATSQLGGRLLGPELGMFAGAFAVGLGSNFFARAFDRPEAITEVPGILILVPGSVGFRSITALLDREVTSGIETAFQMLLIAISLVAGLLIANLVLPKPRRL
jgi:uncharacterized membrane protein YjjP (DUF1212 family)